MPLLNLKHRVRLPSIESANRIPAVVMVHGWLGDENVMSIFDRVLPPGVAVVSPRAPFPAGDDQYEWYSRDNGPRPFEAGLQALDKFVAGLSDSYSIDPQRTLLMGFSQGAAMSYSLLLSQPTRARGAAGMAGFLPGPARRWLSPDRLAGKSVFIAHGRQDETVPVGKAQEARDALAGAGADVAYYEFDGGHKMSARSMAALRHWLGVQVEHWVRAAP